MIVLLSLSEQHFVNAHLTKDVEVRRKKKQRKRAIMIILVYFLYENLSSFTMNKE